MTLIERAHFTAVELCIVILGAKIPQAVNIICDILRCIMHFCGVRCSGKTFFGSELCTTNATMAGEASQKKKKLTKWLLT
jgi:hypothetical protein